MVLADLEQWLGAPRPERFPLAAVITAYRRVGKHFVPAELTRLLARARAALPDNADALRRFLDTALDKHDGRFDNPSYLALHDLPLPQGTNIAGAQSQCARLTALLVANLLRFEIATHDGSNDLLPLMRPDARIVAKRCALGVIVLRHAMARLNLDVATESGDPIAVARTLCDRLDAVTTEDERRMLAVTLLTVYTAHDENLFIRALQCYETAFAQVAVLLRAAIGAAAADRPACVTRALRAAARAMDEVSPMFSLVATMKPEAFMAFREFTDGASAIQSRNYKTIESLCRRPDGARLWGPGYDAAPEVRERVLAGEPTLAETIARTRFSAQDRAAIGAAMDAFEAEVLDWRKTHHNLALRMLGMKRGTGYTAGVPYLAEGKTIPLFACPFAGRLAA